jgi:hypothetical protein
MHDECWLRPDARRAAKLLLILLGGLWAFLAAFTAYAALFWPDNKILDNTPASWVGGMLVLSCIAAAPCLLCFRLLDRRTAWRVNPEGITVHRRGQPVRFLDWSQIVRLRILPFGIFVRTSSRPFVERVHWVPVDQADWFREFAGRRLGVERTVP